MRRLRPALFALLALPLLLAACGDDDDSPTVEATGDAAAPSSTSAPARAATVEVASTPLGEVLVDGDGKTLYLFTNDTDGRSACAGPCAEAWPPLTVEGQPVAGDGVDADELGTMTRDDGSTQVTYHGKPLYRYTPDEKPGDVRGQGVGDMWFAVTAEGEAATAAEPATGGGY